MPTRERMLNAALRVIRKEGADGLTMQRIGKLVGLSAPALYRHFRDKEDLLDEAAERGFQVFAGRLEEVEGRSGSIRLLEATLTCFVEFGLAEPRIFELMFLRKRRGTRRFPEDLDAAGSRSFDLLRMRVEACMESGLIVRDDPTESALGLWAHGQGLLTLYLAGRFGSDRESFRQLYRRSLGRLLRGIKAR